MTFTSDRKTVHPMTLEAAAGYARDLVEMEGGGEVGLFRVEQRYGFAPNTLNHLRLGRAKICDIGLFGRLRAAYLDTCQRQARKYLHKIEMEQAGGDVSNADLAARLREIAQEIEARKAK